MFEDVNFEVLIADFKHLVDDILVDTDNLRYRFTKEYLSHRAIEAIGIALWNQGYGDAKIADARTVLDLLEDMNTFSYTSDRNVWDVDYYKLFLTIK